MSGNDRLLPARRSFDPRRLTPRQKQVVDLVRLGLSNKEIARHLGLSAATVKVHLNHIFYRLEVSNRRQIMLNLLPPAPVGYEFWPRHPLGD